MEKEETGIDSDDVKTVIKIGGVIMGVLEEVMKNKEELLASLLKVLEGKETRTEVSLDGIEFKLGDSKVQVQGRVEFTFVPIDKHVK